MSHYQMLLLVEYYIFFHAELREKSLGDMQLIAPSLIITGTGRERSHS